MHLHVYTPISMHEASIAAHDQMRDTMVAEKDMVAYITDQRNTISDSTVSDSTII